MSQPPTAPATSSNRSSERRRKLLEAAGRLFLASGYDGVSMDAIVAEAGGSKATAYRYFGSKQDLLVAVVEYLCADFIIRLRQLDTSQAGLEQGLQLILDELVSVITSPRHVDFYRLVVTGAAAVPAVGQTWYEHGPQVWHALILRLLEQQRTQGRIAAETSFSNLPQILFDAVFSHLTTRTVMLGQGGDAATFRPLIAELIELVVARVERNPATH
ncbi:MULTISPECIES: TetR/AcrR family transcriptional regulator [unclassified Janthinobacterium]|uniref:TetR/AcrR family transcriptional regulator n=2 Tax=Janthinobacterium TaxID=29580 RepID=UPI00161283CE|nr:MULTISPECIES: TetR/AcrR family transcriptional regulator [unclassified Janthinobacterium]MBB5369877.1 AcrR family transcriptional regulator [Janthinobacterium sp. K2C7]MBB5382683.1 AcrR family transcriptional regulator [Janthinobacterium sp. K2Li3]MBB5384668.1 AcrR family transcriptional regulator [Janthinobacterium sp. K2E3]